MEYDAIGDIHGHAGISDTHPGGPTRVPPPGQQVDFVEDLIDRAPEQIRVVDMDPSMIDAATQTKDQK